MPLLNLPLDMLANIAANLHVIDLIHLAGASKQSKASFKQLQLWQDYTKRLDLCPLVRIDSFWENFNQARHERFCFNYFKHLPRIQKFRWVLTMIDIVLLTGDFSLIEMFCKERTISFDARLLERAAKYSTPPIIRILIEDKHIPLTHKVLIKLLIRNESTLSKYGIDYMEEKGVCDQYPIWKNNRALYNRQLMIEVVSCCNSSTVDLLIQRGYEFHAQQIRYVLPNLELSVFEYLLIKNFISCNLQLLDQCAYAGRVDLIQFLLGVKGLKAMPSTLNSFVRNGKLKDVQYLVESLEIHPTQNTLSFAELNPDHRITHYITQYLSKDCSFRNIH